MKVIVAGIAKTGTKTMNEALQLLGYSVYDYLENFWYLGDDWIKIIQKGATVEDLRRMYEGVDVVLDTPTFFYWEEMLEAFPDAKVILTTRDVDSWLNSVKNQFEMFNSDPAFKAIYSLSYSGWRMTAFRTAALGLLGSRGTWPWSKQTLFNDEAMKNLFQKHNRNVIQNCPKEKLLVYEVKQGWRPLCEFLGVEIPQVEFPHKNKGGSVIDEQRKENVIMHRIEREMYATSALVLVLTGFACYKLSAICWRSVAWGQIFSEAWRKYFSFS